LPSFSTEYGWTEPTSGSLLRLLSQFRPPPELRRPPSIGEEKKRFIRIRRRKGRSRGDDGEGKTDGHLEAWRHDFALEMGLLSSAPIASCDGLRADHEQKHAPSEFVLRSALKPKAQ
jgi:hypothetical protein